MYQLFLEEKDGSKCPFYATDNFEKMQAAAKSLSLFYVVSVEEVDKPLFDVTEKIENENK